MLARTLVFALVAIAAAYAGGVVVDLATPPKYEFAYAVEDPHTGDLKQRAEARIGELTKQEYTWGEKDRIVKVAKVDSHPVPVAIASHGIVASHGIGLGGVGIGLGGLGGLGLGKLI